MALRMGCDVGGTFTDFIFIDPGRHGVTTGKILTTPSDPSDAILAGVEDYTASTETHVGSAEQIVHGTTLGINALLERRGAKTGLLVTRGFRDILDIRRCNRVDMYDLGSGFPPPLIQRSARREVNERIYSDGTVLIALDAHEAREQIRALLREGVESIAICTLHSYLNPAHELQLADLVTEEAPEISVSLSSQVAGEIKEFERLSTTAIDAYLKPKMQAYLTKLEKGLQDRGFQGRMYLMLSGGTVVAAETGKRMPARIVESGPMAGAIAAKFFGGRFGAREVVSYDMGGTSAKACLIRDGEIPITREYEIDRSFRFKRGSGMPLTVPTVDLIEIGAGGGSIARVDELGLLKVGPQSAGAVPGPACYGRGGEHPTVTDADLVLGFLDPDYFLGGGLTLDLEASKRALQVHVAEPLGIDLLKAAWGVHKVVTESMANAIKTCVAERGGNIYRTTMVGFGGAGPVHAAQLARTLKIPNLIVPPCAGVMSALGFLLAPLAYDIVRTHKVPLDRLDLTKVEALTEEMAAEARRVVEEAGPDRPSVVERSAELCFVGQGYPVMVSLPALGSGTLDIPLLRDSFLSAYRARYGHCSDETPIELVSLRVLVSVGADDLPPLFFSPSNTLAEAQKGQREAYDNSSGGMIPYDVYNRYLMPSGSLAPGPALIEERETTTVVPRGSTAIIQDDGSILISFPARNTATKPTNGRLIAEEVL